MAERIKTGILTISAAFLLLIILAAIPQFAVRADMGPKPSFYFGFDFSRMANPPDSIEVFLFQCLDEECKERELLQDAPSQYWTCGRDSCSVQLMTGRKTWQIDVSYSGKTLTSQPFSKEGFYSRYKLVLEDDQLIVEFVSSREPSVTETTEVTSELGQMTSRMNMIQAGFLTVLVELPVAALLLLIFKAKFKNILWVILGNLVSIPVVWLLVPLLPVDAYLVIVFVLLSSSILEMVSLGVLGGEKMTWVKAAVISVLINIASFTAGLFLVS